MDITQEIKRTQDKLVKLDPGSPAYKVYEDVLTRLLGIKAKGSTVTVHKDPNDSVCESCQ